MVLTKTSANGYIGEMKICSIVLSNIRYYADVTQDTTLFRCTSGSNSTSYRVSTTDQIWSWPIAVTTYY